MSKDFSLMGNANEYVFARVIADFNQRRYSDGEGLIRASQGRAMHDRFQRVLDLDSACDPRQVASALVSAIDDVANPSAGGDAFARQKMRYYLDVMRYYEDYEAITGVRVPRQDSELENFNRDPNMPDGMMLLPVSPFDNRYSTRETVRDAGEILYADPGRFLSRENTSDGRSVVSYAYEPEDEREHDLHLLRYPGVDIPRPINGQPPRVVDAGPSMSVEDESGISLLRPYMSDSDYKLAQTEMHRYDSMPGRTFMTTDAAERAASILKMLSDNGYQYKIVPDQNPGQLKARILGTKVEIRVTERGAIPVRDGRGDQTVLEDQSKYVGRVYVDGMILYPVLGQKDAAANPDWEAGDAEVLSLINYALGKRQTRPNFRLYPNAASSPYIGGDVFSKNQSTTYMSVGAASDGKPTFHTILGRDSHGAVGSTVYVRCNNRRNASHMEFDTQDDAVRFLQTSISSARDAFLGRLNVDGLIEYSDHVREWQDAHPGEDWQDFDVSGISDFNFDSNPAIEFRQREYLRVLLDDTIELQRPDSALVAANMGSLLDDDSFGIDEFDDDFDLDEGFDVEVEEDPARGVGRLYDSTLYPTNRERVRQHALDVTDIMFGQFEPGADGLRFDPAAVGSFMNSSDNIYRNNDNLVAAMRALGMDGHDLRGSSFQVGAMKDHLLQPVEPSPANLLTIESVAATDSSPAAVVFYGERDGERVEVKRLEASADSPDVLPEVHLRDIPEGSVVRMKDVSSPYIRQMFSTLKNTVADTGCTMSDNDALIDANGVVQYTAKQHVRFMAPPKGSGGYMFGGRMVTSSGMADFEVHGTVGQIFEPSEQGILETKYNGSENKLFVPGYDAHILDPTPDDVNKPLASRIRLQGLEQSMSDFIASTVRQDLLGTGAMRFEGEGDEGHYVKTIGESASLNSVYSRVSRTALRVHVAPEYEGESLLSRRAREMEMLDFPKEVDDARIATLRGRCAFTSEAVNGSSISAISSFMKKPEREQASAMANDNLRDMLVLTGGQDLSVVANLAEQLVADPYCTGSGKNQGKIFYLPASASVNPDGSINPASDGNPLTQINQTSVAEYVRFSPADRNAMFDSNMIDAYGIQDRVGIAHLTMKGFTFDDGCVISKSLAEKMLVPDENGGVRPAKVGDKICDTGGNKSTISLIVDPSMSDEEAEAAQIGDVVKFFRANPNVELVQAPYPPVSRYNGATAKFMLNDHADLTMPDGTVVPGGMGFGPIQMTRHLADDHTSVYDDEQVRAGKGRSISALLVATLYSKNCYNILHEAFSGNNKAFDNARENMLVLGVQMDADSTLHDGISITTDPSDPGYRHIFNLPSMDEIKENGARDLAAFFKERVDSRGGVLELPFDLTLKSGAKTPEIGSEDGQPRYGLPIMSAKLRSGQRFEDGTSMTHDYTNQFASIYRKAVEYMVVADSLARDGERMGEAWKKERLAKMESIQRSAQQAYDNIANPLKERMLDTKHNFCRDEIFSARAKDSATAIWTADPRRRLDEIAVSGTILDAMGAKDGDEILMWRDPVWREHGVKYMKVVRDDNITGVAINPLAAKIFDGDFDGDSVGLKFLETDAAREEAKYVLSMPMNLLDRTAVRDGTDGGRKGDLKLFINDSMDVASAEAKDEERKAKAEAAGLEYGPTLRERRFAIEAAANDLYNDHTLSLRQKYERGQAILDDLSDWSRDALMKQGIGLEHLVYSDEKAHMASVLQIVDHKAKGSYGKVGVYAMNAGIQVDVDENGRPIADTAKDVGHPLTTVQDSKDVQRAMAAKSFGTGYGGMHEQRFFIVGREISYREHVKATGKDPLSSDFRAINPDQPGFSDTTVMAAGQYLTYLATQGLLQAKHDPIQAEKLYAMVEGPMKDLWAGRKMEKMNCVVGDRVSTTWVPVLDKSGRPQQATVREWIDTFLDMHESKEGLELKGAINGEHLEMLAKKLSSNGKMVDINSDEFVMANSSLVDRMAYRPAEAWNNLLEAAKSGERLFDGSSIMVAPTKVRQAQIVVRDNEARFEKADELMREAEADESKGYAVTAGATRERAEQMAAAAEAAIGKAQRSGAANAFKDVGETFDRTRGMKKEAVSTVAAAEADRARQAAPEAVEAVHASDVAQAEHRAVMAERDMRRATIPTAEAVEWKPNPEPEKEGHGSLVSGLDFSRPAQPAPEAHVAAAEPVKATEPAAAVKPSRELPTGADELMRKDANASLGLNAPTD